MVSRSNLFIRDLSLTFEILFAIKSEIESLITQGKYTEAFKLASKWNIQEFFNWPEDVILIVFVVNDLLKEGKYYQAYTMALSIGILDCWYWPYVPLPDDLEAEQGGDSERGNGELVGR